MAVAGTQNRTELRRLRKAVTVTGIFLRVVVSDGTLPTKLHRCIIDPRRHTFPLPSSEDVILVLPVEVLGVPAIPSLVSVVGPRRMPRPVPAEIGRVPPLLIVGIHR